MGAWLVRCRSTFRGAAVLFAARIFCSIDAVASPLCGESAIALVPEGWSLLAEARGDLGRDQVADIAIVAEKLRPSGRVEMSTRRLIVADFRKDVGKYCVNFTDDSFVAGAPNEFIEEPFGPDRLWIDRGSLLLSFEVFFNGGSWSTRGITYRFRQTKGGLRLIGYDETTMSRATRVESALSINFLTGEMQETRGPAPHVFTRKKCRQFTLRQVQMADIEDSLSFEVDDSRCVQVSSGGE